MIIHGTSDQERPYLGIDDFLLSVDEEIEFWTDYNNTDSVPQVTNFIDNYSIEYFQYSNGTDGSMVELYKVNNGGHIWFNFFHQGKNTNQLIWNFFLSIVFSLYKLLIVSIRISVITFIGIFNAGVLRLNI